MSRHLTFLKHLPYFSLSPKTVTVAKEDLININLFQSNMQVEDYIAILEVFNILPATSRSTLLPPPLVYSRRRAASLQPPPSSSAPQTASEDHDLSDSPSTTRDSHPLMKLGFTNTCFSSCYRPQIR